MKTKKAMGWALLLALVLVISACGSKTDTAATTGTDTKGAAEQTTTEQPKADAAKETVTIKYLDKEYTVPSKVERVVIAGSMESMEDAVVLGVEPVGGITVGGKFPELFQSVTAKTESSGEKMQPNFEAILKMKPDVILGSTKAKPEVGEKLNKIATYIPVSHIATDWEANLNLLAELTGKQTKASEELEKYKKSIEESKAKIGDSLKDKKVVSLRIRAGSIMIYPQGVFFNPILYSDLGLTPPAEVLAAKAQEKVSLEKLSEINPDVLFVQFAESESKDNPNALKDLESNPIWKSMNAVKNNKVYVNVVDPLAQGGTALSKIKFIEAAAEKLHN
ncbi:ABC transporter substrate-binding protein [Paenibacillus sp. ACRRX]|uniref:ABC transporter substrate-binding protein n=1 Tax=unclassified Paenibacillus TaxID=185978 RepID=UPI001EF477F9|nr:MULTISPECIES: ABC transporter substrate-binding protein [unclassified Paenibacillus]MCG7409093.1 ABC transporter substrate-binding protein [Paenibacillus sp. ACRRX]MDK8181907.1 ABC transporter substrate-binding protein [Paenibacillus sp. UMB4589-SE434]